MKALTIKNFIVDFKILTETIDFYALRTCTVEPDFSLNNVKVIPSVMKLVLFNTKWQLAFKRYNLIDEVKSLKKGEKNELYHLFSCFSSNLELAESYYYSEKFKGITINFAYRLNKNFDWASRFYLIFKLKLSKGRSFTLHDTLSSLIQLLGRISKEISFTP